jgi:hypothetical protein
MKWIYAIKGMLVGMGIAVATMLVDQHNINQRPYGFHEEYELEIVSNTEAKVYSFASDTVYTVPFDSIHLTIEQDNE